MRFLILLIISISSCATPPEQTVQKLVKEYIKSNANDPNSYEAVEFGTLNEEHSLALSIQKYAKVFNGVDNESDPKLHNLYLSLEDSIVKNVGFGRGYSIQHTYRAKNKFNAKVLNKHTFYIDSAMTKIVEFE